MQNRVRASIIVAMMCSHLYVHAGDPASVDEPRFASRSKWVLHITSVSAAGEQSAEDVQLTLLWKVKDGTWLFSRSRPDPPDVDSKDMIRTIAGKTHVSWDGRDSTSRSDPTEDVRFKFPLSVGQSWTNEYDVLSDGHRRHFVARHRVVGWEDLKVRAGAFRALRVENELSSRELGSDSAQTVTRDTDWYVPEVQNSVLERIRFDNGASTDLELISFSLLR